MKALRGGLKLEGKKDRTIIPWSVTKTSPPRRVRIPLAQSFASPASPRVRVGDRVRVGEKIAEAGSPEGVALHATVSGQVTEIRPFPHPIFGESEAIEILSDGKDELAFGMGKERHGFESLSPREVSRILQESGVVGLGGEPFPPHRLIQETASFPIHTVILNGCESEPYLTSDHALMMSHPVEILKAGEILLRSLGAKHLMIAVEENKEEVGELLKTKAFLHKWSQARVEILPTRYPQEDETLLIETLLGEFLPPGKSSREIGVALFNVATAFAVYEAVAFGKPLYERVVTIGGECVAQPHNYWMRLGTLAEEGVKYARGFLREPEKVLFGGPMRGVAQEGLDFPLLPDTRAILGLPHEVVKPESVEPCIRCGWCVDSCPVSISPVMITLAAEKNLFEVAQEYGASFCIACGNCSYVCPSKRPMVELIQYANQSANAR